MSLHIIKSNEHNKILSSQQIADKIKSELDNKIEQTKLQGHQIIVEAQQEAEQIRQRAYHDAYSHAYENMVVEILGNKLVKQSLVTSATSFFESIIFRLHQKLAGVISISQRVNKVLHDELTSLLRANEVAVIVHPEALTEIKTNIQTSDNPLSKNIFFKIDANLQYNEFIIQTKDITIVADNESQTELLKQILNRAKQQMNNTVQA